ncbi:MAG: TauD/TfdA family dioxygenase [Azospirillaceae bacterium]
MTTATMGRTELPFAPAPLSPVLGAEVVDFDIRTLDPQAAPALKDCLRDHQVLVFRDQDLTPADMVAFINKMGEPQYHVLDRFLMEEAPEIYVISNMKDDKGEPIGNSYEGLSWHTDLQGQEKVTAYTVLYGVEVPEEGGKTRFASMYKAFEALPDERKRALEPMKFIYSYETQYNVRLKYLAEKGITDHQYDRPMTPEQLEYARKRHPLPIVDVNPHNGRKWIHVATMGCAGVEGMSDEDGIALVNELTDYATSGPFRYDHQWRKRDLLLWDNRGLFHAAGEYDRASQKRLIWRGSIAEDAPAA